MRGMTRKMVRANGIRLNAWAGGEGPALLLLHGYPQTGQMWRKITPSLIDQFSVVCPDLHGYGDSEKPRDGFDKRTMAKDMAELMRELGHETYAVVGHDRGGRVAHRLAIDMATQSRNWRSLISSRRTRCFATRARNSRLPTGTGSFSRCPIFPRL